MTDLIICTHTTTQFSVLGDTCDQCSTRAGKFMRCKRCGRNLCGRCYWAAHRDLPEDMVNDVTAIVPMVAALKRL